MEEKLILKVKEHEKLYNSNLADFYDERKRATEWMIIGTDLNLPASFCKRKWQELRKTFGEILFPTHGNVTNPPKKKVKWKYNDHMSFLIPFINDSDFVENEEESTTSSSAIEFYEGDCSKSHFSGPTFSAKTPLEISEYDFTEKSPPAEEQCLSLHEEEILKVNELSPVNRVPPEILEYIFKFLTFNDLIVTQQVNTKWCAISQLQNLWRHVIYDIGYISKATATNVANKLKWGLQLQHIRGSFMDECFTTVLEAILTYVEDLRRLNVKSCHSIPAHYYLHISAKFPDLVSVTLEYKSKYIVATLNHLSNCTGLKELLFSYECSVLGRETRRSVDMDIARIIGNKFPALTKLDMLFTYYMMGNKSMVHILKKKGNQLKHIPCLNSIKASHEVFNEAVKCCTMLEELRLEIEDFACVIDLRRFNTLKSLSVTFHLLYPHLVLEYIVKPLSSGSLSNIQTLEVVYNYCGIFNVGAVGVIISNLPHLCSLKLDMVDPETINEELEGIGNLSELTCLKLSNYKELSEEGVTHISLVKNLTKLSILGSPEVTATTLQHLKCCTYLDSLLLSQCMLNVKELAAVLLELKSLKYIYIGNCNIFGKNREFLVNEIKKHRNNVSLTITC